MGGLDCIKVNLLQARDWIERKTASNPIIRALFVLFKDSSVYLVGAMLIGLANFVLIPLYLTHLSPDEFAVYALVDILLLIALTISQLGLPVAYLKRYANHGLEKRGDLLGSVLASGGSMAIFCGSLLIWFVPSLWGKNWLQTSELSFSWMLFPIIILENAQNLLLTDLRAQRKAIYYSGTALIRLVGTVIVSMWLIVGQQKGINGIFAGRLAGDALGISLLVMFCLQKSKLRFRWAIASEMIKFGAPLMLGALSTMLLDATGRFFLSRMGTMEQVGYYSVAIKISNIFQMLITQPFGIAWGGLMFQIIKWPNARLIYSKILSYIFYLALFGGFLMAAFTPLIFSIFSTPAYAPAMTVFPMVILIRAISIMEYPTSIGIYLENRTQWFIPLYGLGLIINLIINIWLVPLYGMLGSTIAWLIAWLAIITGMAIIGQKYYPITYSWKLIIFPTTGWIVFIIFQEILLSTSLIQWALYLLIISPIWVGSTFLFWRDLRIRPVIS